MPITASIRRKGWLAVSAALLLLALIAAPAISRMTCVMSGHVSYAVGEDFDCCAQGTQTDKPVLRATCCEFSQANPLKADYVQHAPVVFVADFQAVQFELPPSSSSVVIAALSRLDSGPPPLPQRSRLARIGSYLI